MKDVLNILESVGSNAALRHAPTGSWSSVVDSGHALQADEVLANVALKDEQHMVAMVFPFEYEMLANVASKDERQMVPMVFPFE
ncbi:hypothetical protein [Dyella sp.]|uniref:hypothetical protein n=1 Tax=Dyella sp. TaxID=1869338 RepID=UPI003F7F6F23